MVRICWRVLIHWTFGLFLALRRLDPRPRRLRTPQSGAMLPEIGFPRRRHRCYTSKGFLGAIWVALALDDWAWQRFCLRTRWEERRVPGLTWRVGLESNSFLLVGIHHRWRGCLVFALQRNFLCCWRHFYILIRCSRGCWYEVQPYQICWCQLSHHQPERRLGLWLFQDQHQSQFRRNISWIRHQCLVFRFNHVL